MKLKVWHGAVAGFILVVGFVTSSMLNSRAYTEGRAESGASKFLKKNNYTSERVSCVGDSDYDGYGSCTVVVRHTDGETEKIHLECPTNFMDVTFCKEKPVALMQ